MADKKTITLKTGESVDLVKLLGFDPFIDSNYTTDTVEFCTEEDLNP
jgi:hypothetical protein